MSAMGQKSLTALCISGRLTFLTPPSSWGHFLLPALCYLRVCFPGNPNEDKGVLGKFDFAAVI